MIDSFKRELQTLLSKYPAVKAVKFTVEEEVTAQTIIAPVQSNGQIVGGIPVPGAVVPVSPKPETPHTKAMNAAEQTIEAMKRRPGVTITES